MQPVLGWCTADGGAESGAEGTNAGKAASGCNLPDGQRGCGQKLLGMIETGFQKSLAESAAVEPLHNPGQLPGGHAQQVGQGSGAGVLAEIQGKVVVNHLVPEICGAAALLLQAVRRCGQLTQERDDDQRGDAFELRNDDWTY